MLKWKGHSESKTMKRWNKTILQKTANWHRKIRKRHTFHPRVAEDPASAIHAIFPFCKMPYPLFEKITNCTSHKISKINATSHSDVDTHTHTKNLNTEEGLVRVTCRGYDVLLPATSHTRKISGYHANLPPSLSPSLFLFLYFSTFILPLLLLFYPLACFPVFLFFLRCSSYYCYSCYNDKWWYLCYHNIRAITSSISVSGVPQP